MYLSIYLSRCVVTFRNDSDTKAIAIENRDHISPPEQIVLKFDSLFWCVTGLMIKAQNACCDFGRPQVAMHSQLPPCWVFVWFTIA